MIKNNEPLSMIEALEIIKKSREDNPEIINFIERFSEIKIKDAKELRKKLDALNIMKVRPEHTSKIIDLLPGTPTDLNKIFTDIGLDEDETKKILDTIKEFK